jgi:hypothetical protein
MAIIQVTTAPNRAQYEQVVQAIDLSNRPAGLILHAAAELATGEVQIVDVYESMEAAMAFRDARLIPAFKEVGVFEMVQASPQPPPLEIFDLVR